jgi:hypothetical protein
MRDYLPETWFDDRLRLAPSALHGQGLVAEEPFAAGEKVIVAVRRTRRRTWAPTGSRAASRTP